MTGSDARLPIFTEYLHQRGQSLVEFSVAAMFVLVPIGLGLPYLAKVADARHNMHEAARYAAWERTVWYEAHDKYHLKSNADIKNEVSVRILGKAEAPIDSVEDKKKLAPENHKFHPFLYTSDFKTGKRIPIFKEDSGEFLAYSGKMEDAMKGASDVSKAVNSVISSGLKLEKKGMQTSELNWSHAWIPALDMGLPTISASARNVIMTEAWNAGGPVEIKKNLSGVLPLTLFNETVVQDFLSIGSSTSIDGIKGFEPGRVDSDRVPCQRLTNLTGRSPKC